MLKMKRAIRTHKRENGITTPKRRDRKPRNEGWATRPSLPWNSDPNKLPAKGKESKQLTGRAARRANGYKKGAKAGWRARNKRKASYAAYIESTNPKRDME